VSDSKRAMVKCKVRSTRCEEGIVQGSVQGIRVRNGVISEAACEAAWYCALLGRSMSNSRRQGMDQSPFIVSNRPTV